MTTTILDAIVSHKREEVAAGTRTGPQSPHSNIAPLRPFRRALISQPGVSVIAEIKKASPSKGLLCPDFDPLRLASSYQKGGAAAISILTDERFFQGSLDFLPAVREKVDLPLLRKDFIIDHFQIDESAAWGADAVLLIAAVLDDVLLSELLAHAREKALDALVEVHDRVELERALKAGADLVGVNNRNLKDFSVSLDTTFSIRAEMPAETPLVSESGISTAGDMKRLLEAGITAALIGERLVTSPDTIGTLRELVEAGRP